jgi:hypothetical protein
MNPHENRHYELLSSEPIPDQTEIQSLLNYFRQSGLTYLEKFIIIVDIKY